MRIWLLMVCFVELNVTSPTAYTVGTSNENFHKWYNVS